MRLARIGTSLIIALAAVASCTAPEPTEIPTPGIGDPPPRVEVAPPVRAEGLEVQLWPVLDDRGRTAVALNGYTDTFGGTLPERAELWRRAGLRLVVVPVEHIPRLRDRLCGTGTVHYEWIADATRWLVLFAGPELSRSSLIDDGMTIKPEGPGRLELLARAWRGPDSRGPSIRAQIVPHLRWPEDPSASARQAVGLEQRPEPQEGGSTFAALGIDLDLLPGSAYLILGEDPGADWSMPDKPAEEPEPDPTMRVFEGVGAPPEATSLGQAMLTATRVPATGGESRVDRVVIVLIPRVRSEFRLLGE